MKKFTKFLIIITSIFLIQFISTQLFASIIYNGSEYKLVVDWGITWTEANSEAVSDGWHLATLTSSEENNYIYNNLVLPQGPVDEIDWISYWIGGFQNPITETQSSIGWEWVTGETWDYTNWNSGEPNDFYGPASEYYLEFLYSNGEWNDLGGPQWINGYIAERAVPEPSSILLLGVGLAGLAAWRRKRARLTLE
jgi:hypothetical protein